MKWFVCECWTLFYFLLGNWLRDHTSWASSRIGLKIKSFLKCFLSSGFLNFIESKYAFLLLNSEIYIVYVIIYEWSRSVNFSATYVLYAIQTCIFPTTRTCPRKLYLQEQCTYGQIPSGGITILIVNKEMLSLSKWKLDSLHVTQ